MPSPFPGMDPFIEGQRWSVYEREDGKRISLVRTVDGVTTLVTGTGGLEEEAAYYHLARFAIRHGRHFEAMFLLLRVRALAALTAAVSRSAPTRS